MGWLRRLMGVGRPTETLRHSEAIGEYVETNVGVWTKDGFVPEKPYIPATGDYTQEGYVPMPSMEGLP